jgi:uncharacterized C2H2 Zn-finger protein
MAEQIIKCPKGHDVFFEDSTVTASINKVYIDERPRTVKEKIVTIYLTCPVDGEIFPVRIAKKYNSPEF